MAYTCAAVLAVGVLVLLVRLGTFRHHLPYPVRLEVMAVWLAGPAA